MGYGAIIGAVISTGVKLLGSAGGPDYPSAPKILGLPVQKAKKVMEQNEEKRMKASIAAWKARFPLLYQGGKYEIDDLRRNQQGFLSPQVKGALQSAGLEMPKEGGDQYKLSVDLGLSPITLAQRTSQAVTRNIALNPEWTSKISGGTLATMIANNNKNQNAFSQFLGAQNTANYVAGRERSGYNTAALTSGLLGTAQIGMQSYINAQNPLNQPLNPTSYRSDVDTPGYMMSNATQAPPTAYPNQSGTYSSQGFGPQWGMPPMGYSTSGAWGGGGFGAYDLPASPEQSSSNFSGDLWNSYQPSPNDGLSLGGY